MTEQHIYPVSPELEEFSTLNKDQYLELYKASIDDPESFWAEQAKRIDWFKPFTKVKDVSYASKDLHIRWFEDGILNASYNCLDRHLADKGDQTAIIYEGDDPSQSEHISYKQLHERVCRLANGLKELGVEKGDIVTLYMPMVPETGIAMLACARIGAVHSVVFGGFSPEALAARIEDGQSKWLITADEGIRGGKSIPLKNNVDEAFEVGNIGHVKNVVMLQRTGGDVSFVEGRDVWMHELMERQGAYCDAEPMSAEDPLFMLYTSGSTGKPKGVLHTTGGYLTYASFTHEKVFDYREGEVFWCTADFGWITGHSYILYGPLCNGATTVLFEGVPNYPDASRFWQVVEKHQVNVFYTAPTAIRALMAAGDDKVQSYNRDSIRLLGSVGEPINPEAWEWYYEVVGEKRCPIVDTWWQTETGGVLISAIPGATTLKPGSATRPLFGVKPAIVDNEGNILEGECEGNLVLMDSWPGQMRTVYGDHERFIQTYFSTYEGMYFTGDGARRDADGYYWITGRVDDVLNVSGHRMGTAEIESALVAHSAVAEAAVVGFPHDIKGQGIYVYVSMMADADLSDLTALVSELKDWVRKEIGPVATPDLIQISGGLPKTRSGKIMRRILRKIAANEYDSLGDTSTLADPSVVDVLIDERLNR
ncbi:acetyl-coenzyme A synthetase [Oleiphilus sp. HI0009]|uniref:acetate--CoA ligase n=3 Tax=Oleiphilus TaxID=141450 RepID=UPI0007C2F6EC|nr:MULTISPECIES: acetate--CoA ligase [unclassified Oleiphilus]KZX75099.1 acetyl-coenzyme A synthetase [Oleiphilus sp. HI0009]KZY70061.1 acetyl-coenzyme A synthetase [Oleiphilus sp. HI0067]KZY71745.1 acetyl-coenzyme A synthetase [Oleiphilus sp. HI0066]